MTPHSVHYGHAKAMLVTRQAALDAAFLAHPSRFKSKRPSTASDADRGMDQPAPNGDDQHLPTTAALHSKFMTPGAAKSLTRSG